MCPTTLKPKSFQLIMFQLKNVKEFERNHQELNTKRKPRREI